MNSRSQPEDTYIDPRLLDLTGGGPAVEPEISVQTHLDSLEEFDREVDHSITQYYGDNANDDHNSQFNRLHNTSYRTPGPPHTPSNPRERLASTPIQRSEHQHRGALLTPEHSSPTLSSNLDPRAPPFTPENAQWPLNMPPTPSTLRSSQARQDPFASPVVDRTRQSDIAEGEAAHAPPSLSPMSPAGECAVRWPGNDALPSTARFSRPTLHLQRRSVEASAINVAGWPQLGVPPSHDIEAWAQGQYTVPYPILQLPLSQTSTRRRSRARTSSTRAQSTAGRSHGSFVCLSEGCGRTFDRRGNLNKHARCHQPGRFECGECEKKFSYMKDLLRHMRTHTGEKPFKCPEEGCLYSDQGFSKKDNRDRHVASQHQHRVAPGTPMTGMSV